MPTTSTLRRYVEDTGGKSGLRMSIHVQHDLRNLQVNHARAWSEVDSRILARCAS